MLACIIELDIGHSILVLGICEVMLHLTAQTLVLNLPSALALLILNTPVTAASKILALPIVVLDHVIECPLCS